MAIEDDAIEIGGVVMAPAEGDVKRAMLAARAASELIAKRARKAKEIPQWVFEINAVGQLVTGMANGLREIDPVLHHRFVSQMINAMVADPAELQRIADDEEPKRN